MLVGKYLRTSYLAEAGQISVQKVRNYEADGFIPPATRSPGGYRLYTPRHLAALKTARSLVGGYTWQHTRVIMEAVHKAQLGIALALIDQRHAEIAEKRRQVEQTLEALGTLAAQAASVVTRRSQRLRVGEAARQVGVRVSSLHFWEQQGLLQPLRDPTSGYRLYDEPQMRRLRAVALLREAGSDFPAVRLALDELAAGRTEKAIAAVEKRRADLARTSWACAVGLAVFQAYVRDYWPELAASLE
jgi:DNA-binding transcriptional MerR regulator